MRAMIASAVLLLPLAATAAEAQQRVMSDRVAKAMPASRSGSAVLRARRTSIQSRLRPNHQSSAAASRQSAANSMYLR